jgi:histone H3/H4
MITTTPVKRIIEKAGGTRVSNQAAKELAHFLEHKTKTLALESQKLAEHAGRKTVMRNDVKMAKKVLE